MSVFPHGHIDRSGWKRVRLGDVGYTYNGLSGKTKQDFDAGDAFYIPFLNVLENTEIDINNLGRVNVSALEKQTCVQKNDLFFNTSSETPEEVGMCAYLSQELSNTFLNSFCFGFRLYNIHVAEPRFLVYLFNSAYGRRVISSLAQGVTRYNLSKERLLQSDIHLPPVTEQLRIASCINIVEKNLVEMQTLISKYDAIKKATVNLLLKPKAGWRQISLGDIGDVLMCKRILKNQTTETGDVPFYKIGTFGRTPDSFISRALFKDFKARFSYPQKGDVLLSAAGTIGRTVVFNGEDAYFQDSNIVWIDNDEHAVTNRFLNVLYGQMNWQTENGGTVSRLYNANIRNTKIKIPSLSEQKRIVAILDSIDGTINGLKSQLAKAQDIKQGMMTYFFG